LTESTLKSEIYEFLAETMSLAGQELAVRRGHKLHVDFKADTSLVTEADLASEKVILDRLRRYFPGDKIYSEEAGLSSQDRTPGSYIWVVDPLDGTTNYANGYPFYCISIGRGRFTDEGRIRIETGAILDAPRERLYYASRGEGAFVGAERLRSAAPRDFEKCFLVTGFYYMKGPALQSDIARFARVAERCQSIRRDGAAALDLALVAEGVFDAFWERGLAPWDVAAGSLLVEEAQGHVCNYPEYATKLYDIEGIGVIAGSSTAVEAIAGTL